MANAQFGFGWSFFVEFVPFPAQSRSDLAGTNLDAVRSTLVYDI